MAICKKCGRRTGVLLDIGLGKMLKPLLENTEYDVNSNVKVDSCSGCEDVTKPKGRRRKKLME